MDQDLHDEKFIELMEHHAVIDIPEDTVSMDICIHVLVDGKIETVQKGFNLQDIREMFNKADDGYYADDDVWALTDKGRELADKLSEEE